MTEFPELYVMRHAQTLWNAQGRLQGHFDSGLSIEGMAQAESLAAVLDRVDLEGFDVISSPQGRAQHTARIALGQRGAQMRSDPDLSEIGVGLWAGRFRHELIENKELLEGARGGFSLYVQAPQGEGFAALEHRCRRFLAGLRGPAVLVTHGITSRMIRAIVTTDPAPVTAAGLEDIGGGQGFVFHLKNGMQKRLE